MKAMVVLAAEVTQPRSNFYVDQKALAVSVGAVPARVTAVYQASRMLGPVLVPDTLWAAVLRRKGREFALLATMPPVNEDVEKLTNRPKVKVAAT